MTLDAAETEKLVAYLKEGGLLEPLMIAAKGAPTASDVHQPGGGKKPKAAVGKEAEAEDTEEDAKFELVDKTFPVELKKVDGDQRKVWGWASVSAIGGELVVDKQGDIIPIIELQKAAHDFVLYSREQGDMHSKRGVGRLVESLVFTPELEAVGVVAKDEKGQTIHGWLVGFYVDDQATWDLIKAGNRPEFSIAGRSRYETQE